MADATIQVTSHYDNNANAGESDTASTGSGVSLSGSASDSGASTDKTVPVTGGTDQTIKRKDKPKEPKDLKLRDAEVSCTLVCVEGETKRTHTLRLRGNVSVSARLEGECIIVTTQSVNGEETKIRTRKICCSDTQDPPSDPDS